MIFDSHKIPNSHGMSHQYLYIVSIFIPPLPPNVTLGYKLDETHDYLVTLLRKKLPFVKNMKTTISF
jgi:hypothetical protein